MAEDPGVDPQTPDPTPGDGQEPADKTFDLEYVQKLRKESARYRTQRNEAQTQLEGYADYDVLKASAEKWQAQENEKKSELEKLQEQLSELQTERDLALQDRQDTLIQAAFITEASKKGFANPEDAYRLADLSKVKIEDGKVKGVADAVKTLDGRLPMAKPKAPSVDGGQTGPSDGPAQTFTEDEIREQAAVMNVDVKHLGAMYGVKIEED